MPVLWYCNGDFDQNLTGNFPAHLNRQVDEMTLWFIPLAGDDDRVICRIPFSSGYLPYLREHGLTPSPAIAERPSGRGFSGIAWGWDQKARSALIDTFVDAPSSRVVAQVNSRLFSRHVVEQGNFSRVPGEVCDSPEAVFRKVAGSSQFPLVVKPLHGSAGRGFVRIDSPRIRQDRVRRLKGLFTPAMNQVVVEPWLCRESDYSTGGMVCRTGTIRTTVPVRMRVTGGGSTYGILLNDPDSLEPADERVLTDAAVAAGRQLYAAGYFGPYSVDAMVCREAKGRILYPLMEINARWTLGAVARRVSERLGAGGPLLMRTVGAARCRLPRSYKTFREMIGTYGYSPERCRGILLLTPLTTGNSEDEHGPARSIFLLAGKDRKDLFHLDNALTGLIRPPR